MGLCEACGSTVDEQALQHAILPLRELKPRDFHVCHECVTVEPDACIRCESGVYVPRSSSRCPDYCPACRNDLELDGAGDPGWYAQ